MWGSNPQPSDLESAALPIVANVPFGVFVDSHHYFVTLSGLSHVVIL